MSRFLCHLGVHAWVPAGRGRFAVDVCGRRCGRRRSWYVPSHRAAR